MPQFSDDLYMGPALGPNPGVGTDGNPAPMSVGVGPLARTYVYDVVPLALVANNLATAQAVGAAGLLTLTAGAGATRVTLPSGSFGYVLDVPRAVSVTSTNAGDTTQTATVRGVDYLNQKMTEVITFNGAATVNGKKAFKRVDSITISAALTGNGSAGTTDILGLPLRVIDRGYVDPSWNNTLARDASTVVVADTTSPATGTTGDVRGTILPSSATNGTKRLIVDISLTAIACGPQATRIGAYGVDNFAG